MDVLFFVRGVTALSPEQSPSAGVAQLPGDLHAD
jgi:hypothetical protein